MQLAKSVQDFFRMTEDDFLASEALGETLLKDFAFRIIIELFLGLLFAWTGEVTLAIVWLILVIPAESCESILRWFVDRSDRLTVTHLYTQFLVSIMGGSVWAGAGAYLWMTGSVYHMAAGLAMIVGVLMHVTFKYVDWLKAAVIAALPPGIVFFSLAFLPTEIESSLSEKVLLIFGFSGLLYYMYTVAAGSIAKQVELKKALAAASAASQFKSIFLANMSHEIRTPMNGVLGMADLLDRTPLNTDQSEMISIIQSSGETLIRVIDDILDLSKIEAGHLTLETQVFSLDELVRTISATSEMSARDKNLTFQCRYSSPESSYFVGDALRLRQVIANLVSNAIKFTSEGSVTLELEARHSQSAAHSEIIVKVIDTGPGLSEADQEKIFRPFVQADGSRSRQHGGTGLGLAISRNIVEIMGGELNVESQIGEGSIFSFSCQLLKSDVAPDQSPTFHSRSARLVGARSGDRASILVAEDHPFNRRVLELMLATLEADVHFVEDGMKAVEACKAQSYDLVLMDIQMPGLNGVEALTLIRQDEQVGGRQHTPMIALTANAMKHQVDEYEAAGFDGHLAKPIVIKDLVQVVNEALSERG